VAESESFVASNFSSGQILGSLNRRVGKNAKGAPGLAFETWDPRNQCSMDTHDVTTG
jgi:hypothetical protein